MTYAVAARHTQGRARRDYARPPANCTPAQSATCATAAAVALVPKCGCKPSKLGGAEPAKPSQPRPLVPTTPPAARAKFWPALCKGASPDAAKSVACRRLNSGKAGEPVPWEGREGREGRLEREDETRASALVAKVCAARVPKCGCTLPHVASSAKDCRPVRSASGLGTPLHTSHNEHHTAAHVTRYNATLHHTAHGALLHASHVTLTAARVTRHCCTSQTSQDTPMG